MTNSLQAIADRQHQHDALVAAGEVLNVRFPPGQAAMSLRAAKLLHGLVKVAGADAGRDMVHKIPIAALNSYHISKDEFFAACRELFGISVELRVTDAQGAAWTKLGPMLAHVERAEAFNGDLLFEFSRVLREVLQRSNHWAVLSRQAVLAFQSRYSLRLYEILSIRVGLAHVCEETFSIDDLRVLFGVPNGKLARWADLRVKALEPAIKEVSHLTGITARYEVQKRGKAIAAVRLIWREKGKAGRDAAAAELDRSSIGRAARREGKAQLIAPDDAERAEVAAGLQQLGETLAACLRPKY